MGLEISVPLCICVSDRHAQGHTYAHARTHTHLHIYIILGRKTSSENYCQHHFRTTLLIVPPVMADCLPSRHFERLFPVLNLKKDPSVTRTGGRQSYVKFSQDLLGFDQFLGFESR